MITDTLPANMIYVPGSSAPPAEVNGQRLSWRLVDVPIVGTGVRFRVRPAAAGEWPTNERAVADATTPDEHVHRIEFPVPRISVRGLPTAAPTQTRTPPPSTATNVPAPTQTSEPTPTLAPGPVYLPVALTERCPDTRRPFDVALVIDASNSMAGPALEAAAAAAQVFVDAMRLPRDRVAIVTFNAGAEIRLSLTGDAAEIRRALADLANAVAAGTRLDRGLEAARDALAPLPRAGEDGRVPVVVLLTDGRQDEAPDAPIDQADALRAAGVEIRVVGLGEAVDEPVLQRIAGDPSAYSRAPSADELASVFRELALAFDLCPKERFWGGR